MKYYTGLGDKKYSVVGDGKVSKSDGLLDAIGNIDELNSKIGTLIALIKLDGNKDIYKLKEFSIIDALLDVQSKLFIINAELISKINIMFKPKRPICEDDTKKLEYEIGTISKLFPELKSFVLPGGRLQASLSDEVRTMVRRCERSVVKQSNFIKISNPSVFSYLNRLSSLFFVLGMYINYMEGEKQNAPNYD